MNTGVELCLSPTATESECVDSVVSSCKLSLRDVKRVTRTLITAVQPLVIDDEEVCTDTVMVELVEYATAEQMARETATMTIKKAAFGAFQSTLTSIPKYCFTSDNDRKAVLVHPVSRFTLEDMLSAVEKEYHEPYTYERIGYYTDWKKSVVTRIHGGDHGVVSLVTGVPKYLFPKPPRIVQLQRKTFAYHILRTAGRHHRKGVFHDRITEKTIFFPVPNQPQLLSNYAGVVSPMLNDFIPSELMSDEATTTYGPQVRDVYALALICCRIMTGKKYDGRHFSIGSPRPFGMILRGIVHGTDDNRNRGGLNGILWSTRMVYRICKEMGKRIPYLFTFSKFTAWHHLNRASGGLWRSVPFLGPIANIIAPTTVAWALRYVLDKSWFMTWPFRKAPPSKKPCPHGPGITLLARAFRVECPLRYPQFESVLNMMNDDSVKKRTAFGSLMESGFSIRRAYRLMFDNKMIVAVSAGMIVVAALFMFMFKKHSLNKGGEESAVTLDAALSTMPILPEIGYVSTKNNVSPTEEVGMHESLPVAAPVDTAGSGQGSQGAESGVKPGETSISDSMERLVLTPVSKNDTGRPVTSRKALPVRRVKKKIQKKITQIAPVPVQEQPESESRTGVLVPVSGFEEVYTVQGVTDSCNPGILFYAYGDRVDTIMISQLQSPALRLYMTHATPSGFEPIIPLRLCKTGTCDRTLYYEPSGLDGVGKPINVHSGDALSRSRLKLWQYTKKRR